MYRTYGKVSLIGIMILFWIGNLFAFSSDPALIQTDFLSFEENRDSRAGFDSLSTRFVGNWPFGRYLAVAYDPARNLAYAGSGGGVYILDVSTPSNPVKISEGIHSRGIVRGLFYDAETQRLYLAAEQGGLEIWNMVNPSRPRKLGFYYTPGKSFGVYVAGNYAYITDLNVGLRIIDVSHPTEPREIGFCDTPGNAFDVYVVGDSAYIADGGEGLRVIDVSDPTHPYEVGSCDIDDVQDVYVVGDYAYVADAIWGLRIIDIPTLREIGSCFTPDYAMCVYVAGNYAYITAYYDGLRIIDVSHPTEPREIGFCDTPGNALDVCVVGDYAYLADDYEGFRVINISNPSNPYEEGFYKTADYAQGVYVVGNNIYIADFGAGLRIINGSNPINPYEVGFYDTPGSAWSVYVADNYAYIADSWAGLRIVDISCTPPYEVGFWMMWWPPPPYPPSAFDVYVDGGCAYIALSTAGLRIINISNPSNPYEEGFYNTPGVAYGVYVAGNYAYIADGPSGLRIIDISNDPPNEVGFYGERAVDIHVAGDNAYVADGYAGLWIINVSDPTNPYEVGFCDIPAAAGVYVVDNYAYVVNGVGLHVVDLAVDPPRKVGFYETPGCAGGGNYVGGGVYVADDYAYIADGLAGLQIYEYSPREKEKTFAGVQSHNAEFLTPEGLPFPTIFKGDAKIEFVLPVHQKTKISLCDVAGRVIRKAEGSGRLSLRVNNLAAGIYFLKMENLTNGTSIYKKLVKLE